MANNGIFKIFIAVGCGLMLSACQPVCYKPYSFEITVTTSPIDTMQLTDTLWVEIDQSTHLIEHQTQDTIAYALDLKLRIAITEFLYDTTYISHQPGGANHFTYVNEIGGVYPTGGSSGVYTNCSYKLIDEKIRFKVGLIPHKTGVFFLDFSTLQYENNYTTLNLNSAKICEGIVDQPFYMVNPDENRMQYNNNYFTIFASHHPLSGNGGNLYHRSFTFVVE